MRIPALRENAPTLYVTWINHLTTNVWWSSIVEIIFLKLFIDSVAVTRVHGTMNTPLVLSLNLSNARTWMGDKSKSNPRDAGYSQPHSGWVRLIRTVDFWVCIEWMVKPPSRYDHENKSDVKPKEKESIPRVYYEQSYRVTLTL